MIPWRYETRVGPFVVAETTSLAAANAIERLYENAWAAGLRPMSSVETHVARWQSESGQLDYGNHVMPREPMTDLQVEAWLNHAGSGCAYCGGEHRSDKCLDVRQQEERR